MAPSQIMSVNWIGHEPQDIELQYKLEKEFTGLHFKDIQHNNPIGDFYLSSITKWLCWELHKKTKNKIWSFDM